MAGFLVVGEKQFCELLKNKLGDFWNRALDVFRISGEKMSLRLTTLLFYAYEKKVLEEVMLKLEEQYCENLLCLGCEKPCTPIPDVEKIFLDIYKGVLANKPPIPTSC